MAYSNNDFVKVDFDIYANGKLVRTTDGKLGKENSLKIDKYAPEVMILGKGFVLKALDEAILKADSGSLELSAKEAYGMKKKEMVKTFPKSAFDEQKLKAVVGMTYDFNGMYGSVRSISGGRITVDFNSPLAGKSIKIDYKNVTLVTDICEKVSFVMVNGLKVPVNMFLCSVKDMKVILSVPEQMVPMKEMIEKSFGEMIEDFKNYSLELVGLKLKKASVNK